MGFTTTKKDSILTANLITGKYLGLSTTTPNAATGAGFTEPSDRKYRREALSTTNLTLAAGAGANSRMVKNQRAIEFQPMLTQQVVTHYGVFEAETGGTPIFTAPLTDAAGAATSITIPAEAVFLFDYDADTGDGSYKIEFADEDTAVL